MDTIQNNITIEESNDTINIKEIFHICLSKWYWFVISLVITLSIAVLYLLYTPPIYTSQASILIREDSKGQSLPGNITSSFEDMGMFKTNTNIKNELVTIQSPAIIFEIVKRLHLNVNYSTDGRFYREVLYNSKLPITVSFADLADNESATLTVKLVTDSTVILTDFTRNDEDIVSTTVKGKLGKAITTPIGSIIVTPSPHYIQSFTSLIYVSYSSIYNAVGGCTHNLTASLNDKESSIINLSYQDVSIQRAENILNTLISVYNENWVKDKNQIAVSTSMFIDERLNVIESELGNVDDSISSYKSKNLLPNVESASNMYMNQASETNKDILSLKTQLSMAQYIRNDLTNTSRKNKLLPANSGIESSSLEKQISEYNTTLLQRDNLVANSSIHNPLVIDLDQSLVSMRNAIMSSINNLIVTQQTQIQNLQRNENRITARIAENPNQAKYLLSVERQQKVKEALYLFLLQKREENELSQAFTAYNTRIITPPTGGMNPTAPVKRNILLFALVLGLLIPVTVIAIRENTNTTIQKRKDIEGLTIPYLGEIPLADPRKHLYLRKPKRKLEIIVKEKSRDLVNEAFRIVRTNLEFMVGTEGKNKIIMVSSVNVGSGKSFTSINLATCFAIKKKKVLVIDLDIRKASLSTFTDTSSSGISNYLNEQIDSYEEIISKGIINEYVDIIPVGTIPPNPTELLFSPRLEQLLNVLRHEYDYIFIDCPPIDIVADAMIINKLSDMTLFIIRAKLLDKRILPEIEKLYTEHKYKNMSIILNGTTETYSYGKYYRYGHYHYYNKKGYYSND